MPFMSQPYLMHLSNEQRDQLFRTHLQLGYQPETYDSLLLPDRDRYAGTYMIGVQGVGKSALLEQMIAFDHTAKNAVIVVDAHGDLTTNCLAELPPERLAQTYLLDLEDEAFPFAVNLFSVGNLDTSIGRARAVDRIMHIFATLWDDVLNQQHLPRYVRAATITLLSNPGSTLLDMYRLFVDDSVRYTMLQHLTDASVQQFWQVQYDDLSPAERLRRVQPLLGRLESLFMGRSLVSNILGQPQSTIDFRKAIERKEVLFIRLPVKTVTQDARLIGTILMAQIHAAVFSFANVPEAKRPGVSLYIDEFQNFTTPDIAELFTEGRKYGVKTVVAHQFRGQLPKYLQEATLTARTKVCFQTTTDDGPDLGRVFPAQAATVQPEDISANVTDELRLRASDYGPIVQAFVEWYLQPLQKYRRGRSKVEIMHGGFDLLSEFGNMAAGGKLTNPMIDDPTDFLNRLLYDVMRSGNPNLPIPWEIPVGFSNSGRGFFAAARGISRDDLTANIFFRIPPYLVIQHADGSVSWSRPPEGSKEQLYHFLFFLRMTMRHLAEEPVGKKTAPSSTTVGQMLTQLPRRAAFVRSAETVGVIYTNDTPERLKGRDLVTRIKAVLTQTRQKYCHPREEIEAALRAPQPPEHRDPPTPDHHGNNPVSTPPSRWEVRDE